MRTKKDSQSDGLASLVHQLQAAHAGELAAANAYHGRWKTVRDAEQRAGIQRIEAAELIHRRVLAEALQQLGSAPQPWREAAMGNVGRFFGFMCRFAGWFLPMVVAGRLELMNVRQYRTATAAAEALGVPLVSCLSEMVEEEQRHETWFADQVAGHRLLPLARTVLRW